VPAVVGYSVDGTVAVVLAAAGECAVLLPVLVTVGALCRLWIPFAVFELA
jgi:hypothetical protein